MADRQKGRRSPPTPKPISASVRTRLDGTQRLSLTMEVDWALELVDVLLYCEQIQIGNRQILDAILTALKEMGEDPYDSRGASTEVRQRIQLLEAHYGKEENAQREAG